MAEERFELTLSQLKTAGLWTGDPLEVVIDWQINCIGAWCFVAGWSIKIEARANGVNLTSIPKYFGYGNWDARLTTLKFVGAMPSHDVDIWVRWSVELAVFGIPVSQKIERTYTLPNNDDVSPDPDPDNGIPPVVCTEGDERCAQAADIAAGADEKDLMVCSNAKWVVKEKNAYECGYVPEECFPGTTRCIGTTLQRCVEGRWKTDKVNALECGYVPPDDDDDEEEVACSVDADCPEGYVCKKGKCVKKTFWNEYKWWIIGGLAIVAVSVLIIFPPKGLKARLPGGK